MLFIHEDWFKFDQSQKSKFLHKQLASSLSKEIKTIFGEPAGGESDKKRKAYTWEARVDPGNHEIYQTRLAEQAYNIEFSKGEVANLRHPHNDALVITLKIVNAKFIEFW